VSQIPPETPTDDRSQVDLYWAGYSGVALLPGAIGYLVLAYVLIAFGPSVFAFLGLDPDWGAFLLFQSIVIVGIGIALLGLYRGACFVYRVTATHLYCDFGSFSKPTPRLDLALFQRAVVRQGPVQRLLHVGSVTVLSADRKPLRLAGLLHPEKFACFLEATAAKLPPSKATL
jgi:membrane protein YdbS with pleckstrin-like domain